MAAHEHYQPPLEDIPCATCGKIFTRDRVSTWKRLCIGCWWRKTQARRASEAGTAPTWANRPAAEARTAPPEQGAPTWTPELQAERDRLAAEVADLRTRLEAATKDRDQQVRVSQVTARSLQNAYLELNKLRRFLRSGGSPPVDADLIGRLIKLCHPDKHPEARQAEATAATQDLLQLRKRIQGGA